MPFNGSGVFSIVNTFVPGTTISSSQVNANYTDIATGLSNCLTRDGQAPMTAALELINGSASTPSLAFASEPTLGLYRSATATGGWNGSFDISDDLDVTGDITNGGNPILLIGEVKIWSGLTAPSRWVLLQGDTLIRATYPALWTFASAQIALGSLLYTNGNGTTTFTIPDMRGRTPAGVDPTGTRLTSATMTPNGNTMGAVGGEQRHTLTTAELASHSHAGTTGNESASHTHSYSQGTAGSQKPNGAGTSPFDSSATGATTGTESASHTHNFISDAAGSGTAHNNMQPTNLFQFIMYTGV